MAIVYDATRGSFEEIAEKPGTRVSRGAVTGDGHSGWSPTRARRGGHAVARAAAGGTFPTATAGAGAIPEPILESARADGARGGRGSGSRQRWLWRPRRFGEATQVIWRHGRFDQLDPILDELAIGSSRWRVIRSGISSMQLADGARGFSFPSRWPLDMRMDPTPGTDGATIVNRWSESDLVELISRYGEERWARRIARGDRAPAAADDHRGARAVVSPMRCHAGAPATDSPGDTAFQAVTIAVQPRIGNPRGGDPMWIHRLRPGARIVVLAYHSLEDRIINGRFRSAGGGRDTARDHAPTRFDHRLTRSRIIHDRVVPRLRVGNGSDETGPMDVEHYWVSMIVALAYTHQQITLIETGYAIERRAH